MSRPRQWKLTHTQMWKRLQTHLGEAIEQCLKAAPEGSFEFIQSSHHQCVDIDHLGKACWTGMDYRRSRDDLISYIDPLLQQIDFEAVADRCNFDFELGWGNGLEVNITFTELPLLSDVDEYGPPTPETPVDPIVVITTMCPTVYICRLQQNKRHLVAPSPEDPVVQHAENRAPQPCAAEPPHVAKRQRINTDSSSSSSDDEDEGD